MYIYKYVEAIGQQVFQSSNHREIIDKYTSEGWRFISVIPTNMSGHGVIKTFDLIFEKKVDEN